MKGPLRGWEGQRAAPELLERQWDIQMTEQRSKNSIGMESKVEEMSQVTPGRRMSAEQGQ